MPLVRFELRNEYGLGDPELYRAPAKKEDSKPILEGVAVAGLVGLLRQLGDLAEFSADVFHNLHEQVTATAARGRKMLARIQQIEAVLPSIEKSVQNQTSHIHFAYIAGTDWHANIDLEDSHLIFSDLPRFMMDSYEECHDPPRLYLLDRFDIAGPGACLKRYSDPSYFKRTLAASEHAKAENTLRKKKVHKYKMKGSQVTNGGVQASLTRNQQDIRSTTFAASPGTDSLSISSEETFMSDTRKRPDAESASTYFDSKNRFSNLEQVSNINPSLVPDELESETSSVSQLQFNHNGIIIPIPPEELVRRDGHNYSENDAVQEPNVSRSPSITWDEKTEIVKATSPRFCEDIPVDMVQDTGSAEVCSEPLVGSHEISIPRVEEPEKIPPDIDNLPIPLTGGNQFEEITSETDNYMDALNTMESETEMDSECQTKWEVRSHGEFGNHVLESAKLKVEEVATLNCDSYHIKATDLSNKDYSISNLNPGEFSDHVCEPRNDGLAPSLEHALRSDLSESSSADVPRTDNGAEDSQGRTAEIIEIGDNIMPCAADLQDSFVEAETMTSSFDLQVSPVQNNTMPSSAVLQDSQYENETKLSCADPQELPVKAHDAQSVVFWTNGQLLGLEPSKPPILNTLGTATSTLDSSMQENFHMPKGPSQSHELHGSNTAASGGVYPPTRAAIRDTHNLKLQSPQPSQTTLSISSSLSSIAQRLLANNLQRKVSVSNVAFSMQSEMSNTGTKRLQESKLPSSYPEVQSGAAFQTSPEPKSLERRGPKESISAASSLSGQSSPPLEHMKISFHPINGSQVSKLKLDFSNGDLHESSEDIAFPSFQLLPQTAISLPDSGLESDDDTFCRSCPCSSEDDLSPQSGSDSEIWEHGERTTSKNHEMYDNLSASASSFVAFEENIGYRLHSASGFGNGGFQTDPIPLRCGHIAGVPALESIRNYEHQQEGGDNLSINHADAALKSPSELPPLPPLPPVHWTIRSGFPSGNGNKSFVAEKIAQFTCSEDPSFLVTKQKKRPIPQLPQMTEAVVSPAKKTNGIYDINMDKEESQNVSSKEPDDREDLLQQIRNKSFNLRRTSTKQGSSPEQPTTNVKVSAILEKANAIRQAVVGSDEGGEDDNWSDT